MRDPKVTIIVLNWNGKDDTFACVASLLRCDYPSMEIVVVDNGSKDDSVAALRANFSQVTILETGENLGYVGGNNFGIKFAMQHGTDYVLLLNNDTEVAPDFLSRLVAAAEADEKIGIVSPMIYYHSQPKSLWSAGGSIDWKSGDTRMMGEGQIDNGQFGSSPFEVDFVTGCAILIKMPVIERIGLLDERFFAYYEDTEWCVRAHRSGYRVLTVPGSSIWHKITPEARYTSNSLAYYLTRNRMLFLKLSRARAGAWLHTVVLEIGRTIISYSVRPKWRYKQASRQAMIYGFLDFWRGRFGRMPAEYQRNLQR